MKPSVRTPYGTLAISVRVHPEAVAVIVTVSGPIHAPSRSPNVLGESIYLDYRYDAQRGWYQVDSTGRRPWAAPASMTVSSTTREIEAAVEDWLAENHSAVKAFVVRRLELAAARTRAASVKAIQVASAKATAADALVDEVRVGL
jgi:hypothetical protein